MGRIEQLAEIYGRHIGMPWQQTVAGAQRVIMIVYDKELERTLIARKNEFQIATEKAGHRWSEIDIAGTFAQWLASEEYREAYFESPGDLQLKLEVEFAKFVADYKPDEAGAIPAIKNYFKAYVTSDQIRSIIESRQYTDLATNPLLSTRDFKAVPAKYRTLIPEYVKDYVPIQYFAA